MHTAAAWLTFDERATAGLGRSELALGLTGVAHLLRNLAPVFCLCDARDLGADAQVRAPSTGLPTVFVYDMVPGGIGLAERVFEARERLLGACLETVRGCGCENGCPSCVGPQAERHSPAKRAAQLLLERFAGPGA
jgi:DEAD/DEAH box helicase domain-containing protein